MNSVPGALITLVIGFAVMATMFFITRIFWLWYFQLDKIENHLASISGDSKVLTCGKCQHKVSKLFIACPYCAERSFRHCQECKKSLEPEFKLCPYCNSKNINAASDITGPVAK